MSADKAILEVLGIICAAGWLWITAGWLVWRIDQWRRFDFNKTGRAVDRMQR